MIEPDIDAYGGLARGSAIADYLELLALSGRRCSREQLEDNINDKYLSDWQRKKRNMIVDVDDWDDESGYDDSDATDIAGHLDEAFDCLNERADILGARYPFELDENGLSVRDGVIPTHDFYVAVLCITTAHAYKLDVASVPSVRELFEEVVATTLEARHLLVARMGDLSRKHGMKFPPALLEAGAILGIPTDPAGSPFKRHANDAGADILAHHTWADERLGRWTYAGQVTCGKSDSWQAKMGQASPGLWMGFFQERIHPQCFLAVPHHAPRSTLNLLVSEQGKVLLDRLRIVMTRDTVTDHEAAVIARVLEEDVVNVAAA